MVSPLSPVIVQLTDPLTGVFVVVVPGMPGIALRGIEVTSFVSKIYVNWLKGSVEGIPERVAVTVVPDGVTENVGPTN